MEDRLRSPLGTFGAVEWIDSTPSTNRDLILRARLSNTPLPPYPWLRGAREQTAGQGRAGRPWHNTRDATLMFSCAFAPNIPLAQLPGLAPALGVAACEALRLLISEQISEKASFKFGLKWPNDLQWRHDTGPHHVSAKLAGILVETACCPNMKHPVVVAGIGLNLFGAESLSATLARPIADWSTITQTPFTGPETPCRIVTAIALAWQQAMRTYAQGDFAAFQQRYAQVDDLLDTQVDLIDQGKVLLSGTACGTDRTGRLLIQTEAGIVPVMTGDVSVRHSARQMQDTASSLLINTNNTP
jgi:BirA family biotin operon repressor/biotin-[acetyl-CoA-carboxylase] ligase